MHQFSSITGYYIFDKKNCNIERYVQILDTCPKIKLFHTFAKKSYGQKKTDTDYLAICLVFCPNIGKKSGNQLW